ncbi:hypothetical protein [Cupriavidus taiwanensis]|uniref:hypothetical protein n=1 Tax=Cupriavidus taiwanensis TaxID=164546 RepID=UPI000E10C355|nr:hypothetical protein [Cupriavidus taiwanensis]SOY56789.1 conserved hypothetical protein [Cupriavidus taiwanensis]SOY90690.1 conserved hypothetical protein [Cupriavidus taiwanensis]SOZ63494.1 conserved hypothetical protein [Cupriavidus taiwanensis]SOZ82488.1 conserved hypothetical protein [Cupriavidus taiwanensis]SOZ84379.1 conserved hypothetical protein [Cupriavidus taiwanensis]
MEDRDLLELAAKAAGIPGAYQTAHWVDDHVAYEEAEPKIGLLITYVGAGVEMLWNPLEDDGDALRLACILNIDIQFNRAEDEQTVQAIWPDPTDCYAGGTFTESFDPDKNAATRRAIVRAAAEIGRVIDEGK